MDSSTIRSWSPSIVSSDDGEETLVQESNTGHLPRPASPPQIHNPREASHERLLQEKPLDRDQDDNDEPLLDSSKGLVADRYRLLLSHGGFKDIPLPDPIHIPEWPTEPVRLKTGTKSALGRTASAMVSALIPVCFAILGVFVLSIKDLQQSSFGDFVIQATKVAPTIWPLAFAAIVGGMLKNIAHWKAQNGERLGVIEQLMGSQTVFGTLRMGWGLRALNLMTPLLVILWALSPFGGQAILRSAHLAMNSKEEIVPFRYMSLDPRATYYYDTFVQYSSGIATTGTLFGTALLSTAASLHALNRTGEQESFQTVVDSLGGDEAAILVSRRDAWNHPRIPILDLLPSFNEEGFNGSEWFEIPDDRVLSYSSAFGIPIFGLPAMRRGNASFMITSAHTRFRCDEDWMIGSRFERYLNTTKSSFRIDPSQVAMPKAKLDNSTHQFQTTMPFNNTKRGPGGPIGQDTNVPERPLLLYNDFKKDPDQPETNGLEPYGIICYPRVVYVEANVTCSRAAKGQALQCDTEKVRRLQDKQHLCPSITEIDLLHRIYYEPLNYMMRQLIDNGASAAEQFLFNPATALRMARDADLAATGQAAWNLSQISPPVLADRLTMLWNTWSMASKDNGLLSGCESYLPANKSQHQYPGTSFLTNDSAIWIYETENIYHVNTTWILVYMASVIVLILCAVSAALLRFHLQIPEMLGNVSSLTRDNPYIDTALPTPASTKTGIERARLMKNVYIRVQDVGWGEEVGKLSVTLCSDDVRERPSMVDGRLYA